MQLAAHRLYILSGSVDGGREAWVRHLAQQPEFKSSILSMERVRREVLGHRPMIGAPGQWSPYDNQQNESGVILRASVEARVAQRLTTFIDGAHLSDDERKPWVDLARKHGVSAEVLVFDAPAESRYPCRRVFESHVTIEPIRLPHGKIDVIGDVHGLYGLFERLIQALGYRIDALGVPVHQSDRERRLLLLGDFVDRGPDSMKMLETAFRMSKAGHFVIIGNHERKLIQYWDSFQSGKPRTRSFSSAQTAMAIMRERHTVRENMIAYLRALPAYYVHEEGALKFCFTHGNPTYFDPLRTPYAECVYGDNRIQDAVRAQSSDRDYTALFPDHNRYHMIRGHVGQNCEDSDIRVFSLDGNQAYGGSLMGLRLDAMIDKMRDGKVFMSACRSAAFVEQSHFNYQDHRAAFHFKRGLDQLVHEGLVTCKRDEKYGLQHYKYARRIYKEDGAFDDRPILKARGIVVDEAGNIVIHPFDKIFNFHESTAPNRLGELNQIDVIEKINGVQINIARHPFSNALLVVSNEGFDALSVDIATQYIESNSEFKKALMRHFAKHDGTLIFEVVDPREMHGMDSSSDDTGWWLIGSRDNRLGAALLPEASLDLVAKTLGVRRPGRTRGDYATLATALRSATHEGYIVRSAHGDGPILFKIKTPVYLAEKFMGQMLVAKLQKLYEDPTAFVSAIDEDLLPVIHDLTQKIRLIDMNSPAP